MGLQNKLKKDLLSYLQEDFVCQKVVRCLNNAARGSDETSERKRKRAHVNSTPLITIPYYLLGILSFFHLNYSDTSCKYHNLVKILFYH